MWSQFFRCLEFEASSQSTQGRTCFGSRFTRGLVGVLGEITILYPFAAITSIIFVGVFSVCITIASLR